MNNVTYDVYENRSANSERDRRVIDRGSSNGFGHNLVGPGVV